MLTLLVPHLIVTKDFVGIVYISVPVALPADEPVDDGAELEDPDIQTWDEGSVDPFSLAHAALAVYTGQWLELFDEAVLDLVRHDVALFENEDVRIDDSFTSMVHDVLFAYDQRSRAGAEDNPEDGFGS